MDKMNNNNVWDLAVGKVHRSLDQEEEKQFRDIADSENTKKTLKRVQKIYVNCVNSFLVHRIDKEKNWKYIY